MVYFEDGVDKMKEKRFLIKFILMLLVPIFYIIFEHILSSYKYTFTNLSCYILFAIWFYCTVSTISESYKKTKDDNEKIAIRFISGWGVFLGTINIILMLFILFIATISGSLDEKERFCTINNKKAVSITINRYGTNYYERKTIFIRSKVLFYSSN